MKPEKQLEKYNALLDTLEDWSSADNWDLIYGDVNREDADVHLVYDIDNDLNYVHESGAELYLNLSPGSDYLAEGTLFRVVDSEELQQFQNEEAEYLHEPRKDDSDLLKEVKIPNNYKPSELEETFSAISEMFKEATTS